MGYYEIKFNFFILIVSHLEEENLKFYVVYIKNIFHQNLVYKLNTIFKLLGNIISLMVQYYLWKSLIQENPQSSKYKLDEMVMYISISMVISMLLDNNVHKDLNEKIHKGSISMDLIKPLNLKVFYFYHSMAEALVSFIISSVPLTFFILLVFNVTLPDTMTIFIFIMFMLCSLLLNYSILFLLGILSFWIQQSWVLGRLYSSLISIFSGAIIPLTMYPPFLRFLTEILPFKWIYFIPIEAFLGNVEKGLVLEYLVIYILWIGLFSILANFLWNKGIKNIVINGG